MVKVYIAHPMAGLSDEVIKTIRAVAFDDIQKRHANVVVINSYHPEWADLNPVEALGKALEYLVDADVAYFAGEWEDSRGCQIEWAVCEMYGIPHASIDV